MTKAVARILGEVDQLTDLERAELTERLVEKLAHSCPEEIEHSQIEEIRQRIARVESGEVKLIPGDQALAEIRRVIALASKTS